MSNGKRYTQVRIAAGDDSATGRHFVTTIRELMGPVLPDWVAASDVDPSGSVRSEVFVGSRESKVFQRDEYLDKMEQVEQIIWASLFFCIDQCGAESISGTEDYTESLEKANFLARVVDAGDYYFYGPSEVLDPRIEDHTTIEVKRGGIDQLDFPE